MTTTPEIVDLSVCPPWCTQRHEWSARHTGTWRTGTLELGQPIAQTRPVLFFDEDRPTEGSDVQIEVHVQEADTAKKVTVTLTDERARELSEMLRLS